MRQPFKVKKHFPNVRQYSRYVDIEGLSTSAAITDVILFYILLKQGMVLDVPFHRKPQQNEDWRDLMLCRFTHISLLDRDVCSKAQKFITQIFPTCSSGLKKRQ